MRDAIDELATLTQAAVKKLRGASVECKHVAAVLRVLYSCSLRTEEHEFPRFQVTFMNPADSRRRHPGWGVGKQELQRLAEPIPLAVPTLVKLSRATDPRASLIAVYHDRAGRLFVHGLVDQPRGHFDYVRLEYGGPAYTPPGVFRAEVVGPGHVSAWVDDYHVGDVRVDEVQVFEEDAFTVGPIPEILAPGREWHVRRVISQVLQPPDANDRDLTPRYWAGALLRLVLRVRSLHHGGAILVTGRSRVVGVNLKYKMRYSRLRDCLSEAIVSLSTSVRLAERLRELEEKGAQSIPVHAKREASLSNYARAEAGEALDGALWFAAMLTRVDGLVLMRPNLDILGFGGEIRAGTDRSVVHRIVPTSAGGAELETVHASAFGTRHRSVIRYCWGDRTAVGVVVSSDSHVRVFARVGHRLCMWDRVRCQQGSALGAADWFNDVPM